MSRLTHPVRASLDASQTILVVTGRNRAATPIPIANVTRVEVAQQDTTLTAVAVLVPSTAGGLLIALVMIASL